MRTKFTVIDEVVVVNFDVIKDEKDVMKQLNGKTKQMKGIEGDVVYDEGTPQKYYPWKSRSDW